MTDPEAESVVDEDDEPRDSGRVAFPCRNCGAGMRWNPASYALSCDYCGSKVEVPHGEGTILERPLSNVGSAARGYGVEVRVSRCETCGARVAWEGRKTSRNCVYCGSASVLEQEESRNAIRPESLVPLEQGLESVRASFKKWISKRWFRPNALKRTDRFNGVGIYVPYWTFDCDVFSRWNAEAGHYYYVTKSVRVRHGNSWRTEQRRERRVRWVPAWGTRSDVFDDVLIHASGGLPEKHVKRLGGFDTTKLVPYRPEFLAGWTAEEYALDLEQSWERGRAHIEGVQRGRCSGDVPGDTQRGLQVKNKIADVRWKHILLPIWSLQYEYRSKVYTVLVNGQTGRVVGDAPLSGVKISLTILAFLAVAGLLAFIASRN